MAPKEEPTFYLYSTGLSPSQLTLGTLVYKNYAQPDGRCATYTGSIEDDWTISQQISGCWTCGKESQYGLGVLPLIDLANIGLEFATSRRRVVSADDGRRVVLREPLKFFKERVMQSPDIRSSLALWLTAAKSKHVISKAFFKKPKVYCVTGLYELCDARAWVQQSKSTAVSLGVSSAAMGATTGVPLGVEIGPFSNGQSLDCNIVMPQRNIWAARFHQLNVEYLRRAVEGEVRLPSTITLMNDATHPGGGIMSSGSAGPEVVALHGAETKNANIVELELVEDIDEAEDEADSGYWKTFDRAEERLLDSLAT